MSLSACAYIFSEQILALITVCNPNFVGKGWQASLLTIASSLAAALLSVFVMQKLTIAQGLAIVAHVGGFIAFIAVLWACGPGPETNAYDVFFTFQDLNGWGSTGLAALVGLIGPISTFIGGDPAVHLAEELQDASYVLPRAMVSASGINYLIGAIALITFVFNIGTIDDTLYDYYGQPWVAVIYRITGSKAATIVFIVIICVNVSSEGYEGGGLECYADWILVLHAASQQRHDVLLSPNPVLDWKHHKLTCLPNLQLLPPTLGLRS